MRFEDPILKEDGTIVTWIDIRLLKLAKLVAYLFLETDDETYTPALRRIFAFCGYWFVGIGFLFTFFGLSGPISVGESFGSLYPSAALGGFFIALSRWKRVVCTGTGTVAESQSDKVGALFAVFFPAPMFGALMFLAAKSTQTPHAPECAIGFALGVLLVALAFGYVRRLGNVPPKRKRARVFKLAHSHH